MTFEPKRVSPPTSEEVRPTLNNARNAMRCLMRNCSCEMGMDVVNAVQLTLALTAGIGCGVIIGAMLSRRRVRPFSSANEVIARDGSEDYKMVFVVRGDLKMGKGKVAAQCGHAAIAAYKQVQRTNPQLLHEWESSGCTKVTVKAPDEEVFHSVSKEASRLGLNTHVVMDAGRTQIAPGSKTVLCIGPGEGKAINSVTGDLKLY